MLYGQQRIANKWYNFDTFDGAMKTGFQYIAGQNKWVYYAVDGNNRGQMQYGFQNMLSLSKTKALRFIAPSNVSK